MKFVIYLVVACAWMTMMVGCGGMTSSYCSRGQTCNVLAAGTSVSECNENVGRCVANLSSGQQQDWNKLIGDCLALGTCQSFVSCVQNTNVPCR
ncbi:hypothetical protein L6R29_08465 [Myxococcota bacterium]|nr:hypothetical protein [Myxococcota bacterium]